MPWTYSPLIRMKPSSGCSNPASMRSVVVLPHPDGPSNDRNSPGSTDRLSRSTATIEPNRFVTSVSSTAPRSDSPPLGGLDMSVTNAPPIARPSPY